MIVYPDFEVLGVPRPYIAQAVYWDGRVEIVQGWIVEKGESCA